MRLFDVDKMYKIIETEKQRLHKENKGEIDNVEIGIYEDWNDNETHKIICRNRCFRNVYNDKEELKKELEKICSAWATPVIIIETTENFEYEDDDDDFEDDDDDIHNSSNYYTRVIKRCYTCYSGTSDHSKAEFFHRSFIDTLKRTYKLEDATHFEQIKHQNEVEKQFSLLYEKPYEFKDNELTLNNETFKRVLNEVFEHFTKMKELGSRLNDYTFPDDSGFNEFNNLYNRPIKITIEDVTTCKSTSYMTNQVRRNVTFNKRNEKQTQISFNLPIE